MRSRRRWSCSGGRSVTCPVTTQPPTKPSPVVSERKAPLGMLRPIPMPMCERVPCATARVAPKPQRKTERHHQEVFMCPGVAEDRKSTRLNSSHITISYAVFCLKKKKKTKKEHHPTKNKEPLR